MSPALKPCTACNKTWYCSAACQQSHSAYHIFDCNPPRPINTADRLALAVRQDVIPDDPQTSEDYGFARANRPHLLLGLYASLLSPSKLGVEADTLHRWRLEGTLVENIKKEFQRLPEGNRGACYTRFIGNQHAISGIQYQDMEHWLQSTADDMFRAIWCFIGGSPTASIDTIRRYAKTIPQEQGAPFDLYSLLLTGVQPGPGLELWIMFGFCACVDQEAELQLAQLYTTLFDRCTFAEFCAAYTSSSLLSLFRSKGIGITDPLIIDVLSGTPSWVKSVWVLKQYIELATTLGNDDLFLLPFPSMLDYGFFNCTTMKEHKLLVKLYKRFFALGRNAKPLELHQACVQGRLFAYLTEELGSKVKPKGMYQRLLRIPFPLAGIVIFPRQSDFTTRMFKRNRTGLLLFLVALVAIVLKVYGSSPWI